MRRFLVDVVEGNVYANPVLWRDRGSAQLWWEELTKVVDNARGSMYI